MSITLTTHIEEGDTNYPALIEANWVAIEDAINSLISQVSAVGGEASQLILDLFDRDGIVGAASYRIDLDNYEGGSEITIGRRPEADTGKGDQDLSIAWGTFGGVQTRVTLAGDIAIDASAIVTGLPKTIYIGIPSDGTPQFFEDTATPNVIYVYSMTWDGYAFDITTIERMCPILPGYTAIQEILGAPEIVQIADFETDWLQDDEGKIDLVLPGAASDNGIALEGSKEVLGGMVAIHGGFDAVAGDDNKLVLELHDDEDNIWNLDPIEIDCSQARDQVFFKIDTDTIGRGVFVNEVKRFKLVRTSVGDDVCAAQGITFALFVRPLIGTPVPKDSDEVDQL